MNDIHLPGNGRRLAAFLLQWHGTGGERSGREGLLRTIEQIQGIPIPFSDLETAILPARLPGYEPSMIDELMGACEVAWQGRRPVGQHDGWVVLYLAGDFPKLGRINLFVPGSREQRIREMLAEEDGCDFERISARLGGFGDDLLKTLWNLAWNGEATSDSLAALRARHSSTAARYHRRPRPRYAMRRRMLPGAAGRWRLLAGPRSGFAAESERELARAEQWLRYLGIVSRGTVAGEDDHYERLAPLLARLVDEGKASHDDLLGTGEPQYLAPGAETVWRDGKSMPAGRVLAACDPANPFGLFLPWPPMVSGYQPQRVPGARIGVDDGMLVGYLTRKGRGLYTPEGHRDVESVVGWLKRSAAGYPLFIETVNGESPGRTPWHGSLVRAGFSPSRRGYLLRSGS